MRLLREWCRECRKNRHKPNLVKKSLASNVIPIILRALFSSLFLMSMDLLLLAQNSYGPGDDDDDDESDGFDDDEDDTVVSGDEDEDDDLNGVNQL